MKLICWIFDHAWKPTNVAFYKACGICIAPSLRCRRCGKIVEA